MTTLRDPLEGTERLATDASVGDPLRPSDSATGWYDPDAASWDLDPAAAFEAFRASAVRPGIEVARTDGDPDS